MPINIQIDQGNDVQSFDKVMSPHLMISDSLRSHSELPGTERDPSAIECLHKFRNFYTKRNFDIVKLFATGKELDFKNRFASNLSQMNSPRPDKVLLESLSRRKPNTRPQT